MNRIFNHQPMINAEISATIKTFEENKAMGTAETALSNCQQQLEGIRQKSLNIEECEQQLLKVEAKIDKVNGLIKTILDKESLNEQKRVESVKKYTDQVNDNLEAYLRDIDQQIKDVGTTSFEEAKKKIASEFHGKLVNKTH